MRPLDSVSEANRVGLAGESWWQWVKAWGADGSGGEGHRALHPEASLSPLLMDQASPVYMLACFVHDSFIRGHPFLYKAALITFSTSETLWPWSLSHHWVAMEERMRVVSYPLFWDISRTPKAQWIKCNAFSIQRQIYSINITLTQWMKNFIILRPE